MTETVADERKRLSEFSGKMSAGEIIAWNDMIQDPDIELKKLRDFVSKIQNRHKIGKLTFVSKLEQLS